jgi:hypothetical protein
MHYVIPRTSQDGKKRKTEVATNNQ